MSSVADLGRERRVSYLDLTTNICDLYFKSKNPTYREDAYAYFALLPVCHRGGIARRTDRLRKQLSDARRNNR